MLLELLLLLELELLLLALELLEVLVGHAPVRAVAVPAFAASQALPYVWPSQPQTGLVTVGHVVGLGSHVPVG